MTLKKQDQPTYKKNGAKIKCGLCLEQNVTIQFRDTDVGRVYMDWHHKAFHPDTRP